MRSFLFTFDSRLLEEILDPLNSSVIDTRPPRLAMLNNSALQRPDHTLSQLHEGDHTQKEILKALTLRKAFLG